MKNNKGITLIALVVTIIVLLILAGVSIAMLTGDNGILSRASDAKNNSAAGSLDEAAKIAVGNFLTTDLRWKYSTTDETNNGAKLATDLDAEIEKINAKISATCQVDTNTDYVKINATVDGDTNTQTVYVKINTGAVSTTIPAANP